MHLTSLKLDTNITITNLLKLKERRTKKEENTENNQGKTIKNTKRSAQTNCARIKNEIRKHSGKRSTNSLEIRMRLLPYLLMFYMITLKN